MSIMSTVKSEISALRGIREPVDMALSPRYPESRCNHFEDIGCFGAFHEFFEGVPGRRPEQAERRVLEAAQPKTAIWFTPAFPSAL